MNKEKYNKKSLFNCFKAVVDEDDDFKPPKRRKHGVTTNYVLNPAIADDEDVFLFSPGAKEERGNQQRKRGRETWHALRMAINDTTLVVFFHLFYTSFLFFFPLVLFCVHIFYSTCRYMLFYFLFFIRIICFFMKLVIVIILTLINNLIKYILHMYE